MAERSAERLKEYRRKRSFSRTPEPRGEEEASRETVAGGRFVVQQHDATNLHWDLRLEHDGVAMSWALPRGIPQLPDRKANRLAVRTEDHPLKYLDFEGDIPSGEYGAGQMSIWDRGTYEAEKLRKDEVIATFRGERLQGRYALFQTGGKNWMIHRMDPPLDPERELMPDDLRPMQPVRGELPKRQSDWGFEIAWGGLRTLLWCEPGHIRRSQSRGLEVETVERFPELRRIARSLGATEAVLDGEVVVLRDGSPNPEALRLRKRAGSESSARTLSKRQPGDADSLRRSVPRRAPDGRASPTRSGASDLRGSRSRGRHGRRRPGIVARAGHCSRLPAGGGFPAFSRNDSAARTVRASEARIGSR